MDIIITRRDGKHEIATLDVREVAGELQINNVVVEEAYRRKHIATDMFEELFAYGKRHSCTKISLEVREANEAARALYEKLGFVQVGTRPDFYSNPTDNAILMDKTL